MRRDDCCHLGLWLSAGGARYGHAPVFRELVRQHKALHEEFGRAAEGVNQGRYPEVRAMLEPGQKLQHTSRAMMGALKGLLEQVAPPVAEAEPADY